MAHQTEIVINGVSTAVTEFDHTAQEIDDGIDKVNTLTGEDIPTSASDPTSISSQLSNLESNKRAGTTVLINQPYAQYRSPGEYVVRFDPLTTEQQEILGWPACGEHLGVSVYSTLNQNGINGAITIARGRDSGRQWESHEVNGVWSDWVLIPTATKPQEFYLPLAEGVSAVSSAYWKDRFGVVAGHFNVLASASQTGSSPVIATLPEGFRPSRQAYATAVVSSGESLGLIVRQTGEIQLQDTARVTLEGKYVKGIFSFVAAS